MGNGNNNVRAWLAGLSLLTMLGLWVITAARDTPTRAEVKQDIKQSQDAIQLQLKDIKEMTREIRALQLEMLMSDGGDRRRGEGN